VTFDPVNKDWERMRKEQERQFEEVSTESHVNLSLGHSPINAAQVVSRFTLPSQAQFHSTKHHQDHATPRQTSKFDDSYCIRIARPWGRNNFTVHVFIFCFRLISTTSSLFADVCSSCGSPLAQDLPRFETIALRRPLEPKSPTWTASGSSRHHWHCS